MTRAPGEARENVRRRDSWLARALENLVGAQGHVPDETSAKYVRAIVKEISERGRISAGILR